MSSDDGNYVKLTRGTQNKASEHANPPVLESDKGGYLNSPLGAIYVAVAIVVILVSFIAFLYRGNWGVTGPLGDTVGGLAGPIFNFLGLVLVYYSLKEQAAATKLQAEATNDQIKANRNQVSANAAQYQIARAELIRASNENVINTSYKLIDNLKSGLGELKEQDLSHVRNAAVQIRSSAGHKFQQDFEDWEENRITARSRKVYDGIDKGLTDDQRSALWESLDEFDAYAKFHLAVVNSDLAMLYYVLSNSKLPANLKIILFTQAVAVCVDPITTFMNGVEPFRVKMPFTKDLIDTFLKIESESKKPIPANAHHANSLPFME